MDASKPPIFPSEFRLRSASERTSADIDAAPRDGASVAVYYRNEEQVREGFLIALRAMGVAAVERLPESPKPSVRGPKP